MALSAQKLTQLPCPNYSLSDFKLLASEVLPYYPSAEDAYEDEAYIYSAFGTTCHQVLYPRKTTRLVVSRPKKPLRKGPRKTVQWPDACNAKEVATFYQRQIQGGVRSKSNISKSISAITQRPNSNSALLIKDTCFKSAKNSVDLSTIRRTRVTSIKSSGKAPARGVVPAMRFGRGTNEA
ncbi:hypothetical protein BDZ97DRAFT_1922557 [Flammula alnicola]|nr:hypothetical protein BDZ97DRAFT_1922557 [Flammula alnicola]